MVTARQRWILVLKVLAWVAPALVGMLLLALSAVTLQTGSRTMAWWLLVGGAVTYVSGFVLICWGDYTGRMPAAQRSPHDIR
jgi:hypothetical protein